MGYIIERSNELHHHGVLGQKWGIRRYQNKDGTLTNAGKKHEKQLRETDRMSDEELRNKVNRMRDEETYTRIMSNRNPSKFSKGAKLASGVLQLGNSIVDIGASISNAKRPNDNEIDQNKSLSKEQKESMKETNRVHRDRQEAVRSTLNNSRKVIDESDKIRGTVTKGRKDSKIAVDLHKMSDAELKKQINRMMLEEQYDRLIAPQRVSRGERFTNTVLPVVSSTVAIAGGVVSLALGIQKLSGKNL